VDFSTKQNIKLASEVQNSIRADRRLQITTQVQVRANHGIVTLFGHVASDAERMAAAQDAAHIAGVEALVNALHVPTTNPHSLSGTPQKASAIIPSVGRSLVRDPATSSASSSISLSETSPSPQELEQVIVPRGTVIVVRLAETFKPGARLFPAL
jgi:BON domain